MISPACSYPVESVDSAIYLPSAYQWLGAVKVEYSTNLECCG